VGQEPLLVVTNARAGSADDQAVLSAVEVLRAAVEVEVRATTDADDLDDAIRNLERRRLVVIGGDGSLHAAIAALRRGDLLRDTAVGLIPLGTGNDFARTIGLTIDDPALAARELLASVPKQLDLLEDSAGGIVVNVVHVGLGAEAAMYARPFKDWLGPLAYPVGATTAGIRSQGWRLRIEVDGRRLVDAARRTLMVAVAVGRTVGGGTEIAPDAVPDDGMADVVALPASPRLRRIALAARLRRGTHVHRPDVRTARGQVIEVSGEAFPANADGEVHGPVTRQRWTVRREAWTLLVPLRANAGSG
jgi:YegS/Rv2252/BmrU family lipid kinase